MYTRFKECLLKPSRISKYVYDNKRKTILYFFIILFLHILPLMVTSLSSKQMPVNYKNYFISKFETSEKINYKLETINNKTILIKTVLEENGQYINLGVLNSTGLPILVLFDDEKEYSIDNYKFDEDLYGKSAILVRFGYEELSFTVDVLEKENLESKTWSKGSYDKLGFKYLDFSMASKNITIFSNQLDQMYTDVFNHNKTFIYLIMIPTIIFSGILSLLSQILLIALLFKIMYRNLNLSYGILCKMVLCAFTPSVVFNLLSVVYSSMFMYFIGEILVVIYLTIAIKNIVITRIGNDIEKIIKDQGEK